MDSAVEMDIQAPSDIQPDALADMEIENIDAYETDYVLQDALPAEEYTYVERTDDIMRDEDNLSSTMVDGETNEPFQAENARPEYLDMLPDQHDFIHSESEQVEEVMTDRKASVDAVPVVAASETVTETENARLDTSIPPITGETEENVMPSQPEETSTESKEADFDEDKQFSSIRADQHFGPKITNELSGAIEDADHLESLKTSDPEQEAERGANPESSPADPVASEDTETAVITDERSLSLGSEVSELVHTVRIIYNDEEMSLFPPAEGENSVTYLLPDASLSFKPLQNLFEAIRTVLDDSIDHEDDLELVIAQLNLKISELSKGIREISFTDVLNVIAALQNNDHTHSPQQPLVILRCRRSLLGSIRELKALAKEGHSLFEVSKARGLDQELHLGEEVRFDDFDPLEDQEGDDQEYDDEEEEEEGEYEETKGGQEEEEVEEVEEETQNQADESAQPNGENLSEESGFDPYQNASPRSKHLESVELSKDNNSVKGERTLQIDEQTVSQPSQSPNLEAADNERLGSGAEMERRASKQQEEEEDDLIDYSDEDEPAPADSSIRPSALISEHQVQEHRSSTDDEIDSHVDVAVSGMLHVSADSLEDIDATDQPPVFDSENVDFREITQFENQDEDEADVDLDQPLHGEVKSRTMSQQNDSEANGYCYKDEPAEGNPNEFGNLDNHSLAQVLGSSHEDELPVADDFSYQTETTGDQNRQDQVPFEERNDEHLDQEIFHDPAIDNDTVSVPPPEVNEQSNGHNSLLQPTTSSLKRSYDPNAEELLDFSSDELEPKRMRAS